MITDSSSETQIDVPPNRPLLALPHEHAVQTRGQRDPGAKAVARAVEPHLDRAGGMRHSRVDVVQRAERGLDPDGPETGASSSNPGLVPHGWHSERGSFASSPNVCMPSCIISSQGPRVPR